MMPIKLYSLNQLVSLHGCQMHQRLPPSETKLNSEYTLDVFNKVSTLSASWKFFRNMNRAQRWIVFGHCFKDQLCFKTHFKKIFCMERRKKTTTHVCCSPAVARTCCQGKSHFGSTLSFSQSPEHSKFTFTHLAGASINSDLHVRYKVKETLKEILCFSSCKLQHKNPNIDLSSAFNIRPALLQEKW